MMLDNRSIKRRKKTFQKTLTLWDKCTCRGVVIVKIGNDWDNPVQTIYAMFQRKCHCQQPISGRKIHEKTHTYCNFAYIGTCSFVHDSHTRSMQQ